MRPSLADLIARWEEAFARGEDLTPEHLSPDDSEMAERLRQEITPRRIPAQESAWRTVAPDTGRAPDDTVPHADGHAEAPPDLPPGYEPLGELGRGGMGVVYKARHLTLGRVVALKMILAGTHAGADERARFLAEAEAIARVRHPGIVQVYDYGTHAGLPYFSLELCEGGSLADRLRESPLPADEAARLVEKVARAVQAAHAAGVIHRDLKPGNVLLDGQGEPRVTDFGLAKRPEGHGTVTGAVVGTPSYMPPEQALGRKDVGPAADVWSLGAMLYECLTGRPPFRAATVMDTLLQVINDEPATVRALQSAVPLDLETICHKCLQRDPARRYASAGDLADDLRRYLAGEPIKARPPSIAYVTGKFISRHRLPLSAAAAVLILGVAGTLWAFFSIRAERNDAIDARGREEEKRIEAQKARADLFAQTRTSVVLYGVVDQASTALNEEEIPHFVGLGPVQEELAAIRLEGLKKLRKESPDDESVPPRLARAHLVLGVIRGQVGSYDGARRELQGAADLFASLAEKGGREHALGRCEALRQIAALLSSDYRRPEARAVLLGAVPLAEADPSDEGRFVLARCLIGLAANSLGDKKARAAAATRAAGIYKELVGKKHREVDSLLGLAVAEYNLHWAKFDGRDHRGHLKALARIAELDGRAEKLRPDSPLVARMHYWTTKERADALFELGRPAEGLKTAEEAVAIARKRAAASPDLRDAQALVGHALFDLGQKYRRLGRAADALAALEECCRQLDGVVARAPDHAAAASDWLADRNDLADLLAFGPKTKGEVQAGQDLLRTLDVAVRRGRGFAARFPDHRLLQANYAKALDKRATYETEAKRPEKALPFLLEAARVTGTRLVLSGPPPSEQDVAMYLERLRSATYAAESTDADEALRLSLLAMAVRGLPTTNAGLESFAGVMGGATKALRDARRFADAARLYRVAIDQCLPALEKAPWHWYLREKVGGASMHLADAYRTLKDHRREVLARREHIRHVVGPWWGGDYLPLLDPKRPADEAEADRLLAFIKTRTKAGMKRFTIPCDFNGVKYPFHVYVTNVPFPKHPLADQAAWLKNERGGTIPDEVMVSFARLHKIGHENKVSFVDLCIYALGAAAAEEGQKVKVEKIDDVPIRPAEAPDPLAEVKARLVDARGELDRTPGDLTVAARLAELHVELGRARLAAKAYPPARDAFREAVRLRDGLAGRRPLDPAARAELASAFGLLAEAELVIGSFDAAYAACHQRLDVLEHLIAESSDAAHRKEAAAARRQLGDVEMRRGKTVAGMRWHIRAALEGDADAAGAVAAGIKGNEDLRALLPSDAQAAYAAQVKAGQGPASLAFVANFSKALQGVAQGRARAGTAAALPPARERAATLAAEAERRRGEARSRLAAGDKTAALAAITGAVAALAGAAEMMPADVGIKFAHEDAVIESARMHADAGQGPRAVALLEPLRKAGAIKAALALAGLYEAGGLGVPADPSRAIDIRTSAHFTEGMRLYEGKKYEQARAHFEAAVKWRPAIGYLQRVGWCLTPQGRFEEAIFPYSKALRLAKEFKEVSWVALEWVESCISAGRPDLALEALDGMEKRGWKPEQTPNPYTIERELAGLKLIALLMAGKDAAAAEKAFEAVRMRPNLRNIRAVRHVKPEAWAKASKPTIEVQTRVAELIGQLGGSSHEITHPHAPLKKGARSIFSSPGGGPNVVATVGERAPVGERDYHRVEMVTGGKSAGWEQLAVYPDGLYARASWALTADRIRVLPLPAKGGENWSEDALIGKAKVKVEGATRRENVTVPAGTFKGAIVSDVTIKGEGIDIRRTAWYAEGVGPVKIVTRGIGGETTLELESPAAPKGK